MSVSRFFWSLVVARSGWRNNDTANIMYCPALPEHFEMRPSAEGGEERRGEERRGEERRGEERSARERRGGTAPGVAGKKGGREERTK
jgi:hypothetical protein